MAPRTTPFKDWFIDPATNEMRPRVMLLICLVLAVMFGLLFRASVEAVLAGRQYLGGTPRRSMGNRMPADIAMVVSGLVTVLCGAGVFGALVQMYPRLEDNKVFTRLVAWALVAGLAAVGLLLLGVIAIRILT